MSFGIYLVGYPGISLLEKHDGAEAFRWEALAGPYAAQLKRVRHTETLLFVEDEPRQLQLMQSFLKGEGFTVLTATDGAEAVEVHRRFKDEIAVRNS